MPHVRAVRVFTSATFALVALIAKAQQREKPRGPTLAAKARQLDEKA